MTGRLGASADGSSTLPDSINLIKKALAEQVPFLLQTAMKYSGLEKKCVNKYLQILNI